MKLQKLIRSDQFLVERGFAETRAKAQTLILTNSVTLLPNDIIDKPSRKIPIDSKITIISQQKFVSKGGEKLEKFFTIYPIDVTNANILDIGASTGGFTDCLLQRGAKSATCIDVGHGQLHDKLQKDSRVESFENTNAKDLTTEFFNGKLFDFVVCDVSFISLKKILPTIWQFTKKNLIALIKPQFEAEKSYIKRCHGIIKDKKIQEKIRDEIIQFSLNSLPNSMLIGSVDSPTFNSECNREFLMGLCKNI